MMIFISLILLLFTAPILASDNSLVTRVIDGDTIVVGGQKIRYIGVNAPEAHRTDKITQEIGKKAKAFNESLVLKKPVRLEFDVQQKDKFGRFLAYIYVEDVFVNAEMVRAGYASASTYPPNIKYAGLFRRLEKEARRSERGLWACK